MSHKCTRNSFELSISTIEMTFLLNLTFTTTKICSTQIIFPRTRPWISFKWLKLPKASVVSIQCTFSLRVPSDFFVFFQSSSVLQFSFHEIEWEEIKILNHSSVTYGKREQRIRTTTAILPSRTILFMRWQLLFTFVIKVLLNKFTFKCNSLSWVHRAGMTHARADSKI